MSRWLPILVLLFFSLAEVRPAHGNPLRFCVKSLTKLLSPSHWNGTSDIQLSEPQKSDLLTWQKKYTTSYGAQAHLLDEQALLEFSDLSPTVRKEIFTRNETPLTLKQVNQRINAIGLSPNHSVIRSVIDTYSRFNRFGSTTNPYLSLETRIEQLQSLPSEERSKIRGETRRRLLISEIVSTLKSPRHFQAKVEGMNFILPDGQVNEIVKKLKNGTLLVNFDYHQMLRTQDYFNGEIFAKYVKEKNGDGVGFDGSVTPDGRLFILDGHHRTTAYAHRHDGKVLGRIYPASDGNYYTTSHVEILNFYQSQWSFSKWFAMSEEELIQVLEDVRKQPNHYLREDYYRSYRGRDPKSVPEPNKRTWREFKLYLLGDAFARSLSE